VNAVEQFDSVDTRDCSLRFSGWNRSGRKCRTEATPSAWSSSANWPKETRT